MTHVWAAAFDEHLDHRSIVSEIKTSERNRWILVALGGEHLNGFLVWI